MASAMVKLHSGNYSSAVGLLNQSGQSLSTYQGGETYTEPTEDS